MSSLGQPLDRVDGHLKVCGEAPYTADVPAPRLAHAVLVLSTVPAGTVAIDATAAQALPGVLRVITAATAPRLPGPNTASPPAKRALSLLQDDRVRYDSEPIAVVVAETLEQAQAARDALVVRYRGAAAALDYASEKARAYAPKSANQMPADLAWGDVDTALAGAAQRIEAVYTTPTENHNPMEPHATLAQWHGEELIVHDATQGVSGCRDILAQHFGVAPQSVRVISSYLGGGFGCKGSAWSHVVLAAMAARALGRPVRLVLDRPQMFAPVGHRPFTEQRVVLGADADGKLLALRHHSTSVTSVFEDWVEPCAAVTRVLYACANGDTRHRLVKLNVGTPTFMRAPGEATGTFALESAMDELAVALKMDPIALRLLNHADKDPAEGKPFSSKSLRECYRLGAERFGWAGRAPAPRATREGALLIGTGMATATYPARRSKAAALVRLEPDGRALVRVGTQDLGTGTYTVMTQVAADALGLPVERVRVELGDTRFPHAPVSGGSQTVASVGPAIADACREARERLVALAVAQPESPLHGLAVEAVEMREGWLIRRSDTTRRDSIAGVLARNGGAPVEARAEAAPGEEKEKYALHSFGAVFAEVSVDADLGEVRLRRLLGVYDVGRRLNAKTARSQLLGGLVWGAGMALMEDTRMDRRSGRIVNANLAEYHVPVNADIGAIDALFVDSADETFNPLGARGIGEIGITGAAAAIANAVYHATGRRIRDLPITLDKLIA